MVPGPQVMIGSLGFFAGSSTGGMQAVHPDSVRAPKEPKINAANDKLFMSILPKAVYGAAGVPVGAGMQDEQPDAPATAQASRAAMTAMLNIRI